jgi:hypothetical protein
VRCLDAQAGRHEAHKKFKINRVFYPAAGYFIKGHDRCGSDASGRPASFLGAARGELIGWAGQRLHEIPKVPAATAQQHAAEHDTVETGTTLLYRWNTSAVNRYVNVITFHLAADGR